MSFLHHLKEVTHRFERQVQFAEGYSPLYQVLFQTFANWGEAILSSPNPSLDQDLTLKWLMQTSQDRSPFEVPLLLMAGLHEIALSGETPELSAYYPTTGGSRLAELDDPVLEKVLRQTIDQNQDLLEEILTAATVQTNETGRGLIWLLPLSFTPWTELDLVDLGASAGLNLLADYRTYLLSAKNGEIEVSLGTDRSPDFFVNIKGDQHLHARIQAQPERIIRRRIGCDLLPFHLQTLADEMRLKSYVWGDQINRIARLESGLNALRDHRAAGGSFELMSVKLPDEVLRFLKDHCEDGTAPLLLYNTFVTQYFRPQRTEFMETISTWAAAQPDGRPILWLQWEPPFDDPEQGGLSVGGDEREPDEYGWLEWRADLWWRGAHQVFVLGWVHPHGKEVRFLPGMGDWIKFIRE
ncbi:MAG: DUF2332 family protein [Chloroflexota bacterium]